MDETVTKTYDGLRGRVRRESSGKVKGRNKGVV